MVPVNTSKYINTYQYVQSFHFSYTYQYQQICSNTCNTYHTYQCFPIQVSTLKFIQTNTYQYLQYILLLTITYKYSTYHWHTYQYIPYIQYRSIQINKYKHIINSNTYQYIQILTNTGQYCQIHTNTDTYR